MGFLRNEDLQNRWARRVFSRLEWPAVISQYLMFQRMAVEEQMTAKGKEWMVNRRMEGTQDGSIWTLPWLPPLKLLDDSCKHDDEYYKPAGDRSVISKLGQYLAGRWAAKEAAMKAHSYRRLYMADISILSPRRNPSMFSPDMEFRDKAVALIDPECNTVLIDERVARIRKLRGFDDSSAGLQKGPLFPQVEANTTSKDPRSMDPEKIYLVRRSKVREADRQIAEINISHDGNTAAAVCMAVNEPNPGAMHEYIIDDGEGPSLHEPQFGDAGWFADGQLPTYNNISQSEIDSERKKKREQEAEAQKAVVEAFYASSKMNLPFLP